MTNMVQIDNLTLAWATHRLGGIQTPANAAYTVQELEHQLRDSGAKCLFTCVPLLDSALQAAKAVGIPKNRIYLLDVPESIAPKKDGYKTLDQLIKEGEKLQRLEELKWSKGEGARRTAFLCYSSGTSGLPVCTRVESSQARRADQRNRKES
jgi:long-subunit acyl-CoA synthetase (AMP-forming)